MKAERTFKGVVAYLKVIHKSKGSATSHAKEYRDKGYKLVRVVKMKAGGYGIYVKK